MFNCFIESGDMSSVRDNYFMPCSMLMLIWLGIKFVIILKMSIQVLHARIISIFDPKNGSIVPVQHFQRMNILTWWSINVQEKPTVSWLKKWTGTW